MSTSASLYGRLVRDPELKSLPSGTEIAEMRVACDMAGGKQDDGTYGPGFFDVVVFGKQAENVGQYLTKGSPVYVAGALRFREWEAKDGGKRSKIEIVADRVRFGPKQQPDDGMEAWREPVAIPPEDDIPF